MTGGNQIKAGLERSHSVFVGTCFFPLHQSSSSVHSQEAVASPGQNFMLKLQQPQQNKCKSVLAVEQAALTSSSSAHAMGTPK